MHVGRHCTTRWRPVPTRCQRGVMNDGIFDDVVARTYDESSSEMFDDAVLWPTVDLLVDLADGGRVLEFAVGTGRVAVPLSARGVDVCGIETSRAMVARMAVKPGAGRIAVTIGDMASTRVEGTFSLVYLVYNTITNLLSQEEQVQCFRNAAAHLEPGGCFVVETFVPALRRLPLGERFVAFDASPDHACVDEYDVVDQQLVSHHYWVGPEGTTRFDSPHRWAFPAEYDLMARLAGMSLDERWGDWQRSPFTAESTSHVSVWRTSRER